MLELGGMLTMYQCSVYVIYSVDTLCSYAQHDYAFGCIGLCMYIL